MTKAIQAELKLNKSLSLEQFFSISLKQKINK